MTGRRVLVSGASRGIGRKSAEALAKSGFDVLAGVRSQSSADEVRDLNDPRIRPVILDITSPDSIAALIDEVSDDGLFGLVNNAGTAVIGPLEFLPIEDIRQVFEVNFFGHVAVIQAMLPMLRAAKGRVINISSISGFIGFPFFGAYSASKFAIEGLSDVLRRELRGVGVDVSVVQPGNMDTDIWTSSLTRSKSLEDRFPSEAIEIYGQRFAGDDPTRHGPRKKSDPATVAEAVVRAMTDRRPKARYVVGDDAKRLRIRRLLPDRILDRLI